MVVLCDVRSLGVECASGDGAEEEEEPPSLLPPQQAEPFPFPYHHPLLPLVLQTSHNYEASKVPPKAQS